jgi:hypothetical protein
MLHRVDCKSQAPRLSPDDLACFEQDGAIVLQQVFPENHYSGILQELAQRIELLEQRYTMASTPIETNVQTISDRLLNLAQTHPNSQGLLYDAMDQAPGMHRFASETKLLDIIRQMLSPAIEIHSRYILLMSMPNHQWHLAGWHQDWYYNKGPESTLTIYAPLQKTDTENGSLLLALGEHQKGFIEHGDHQPGTKWHTLPPETINRFNRVAAAEVNVGDILIFNSLVPHTARVNRSTHIRFVINLRYRDLSEPTFLENDWQVGDIQTAKQALARKPY